MQSLEILKKSTDCRALVLRCQRKKENGTKSTDLGPDGVASEFANGPAKASGTSLSFLRRLLQELVIIQEKHLTHSRGSRNCSHW